MGWYAWLCFVFWGNQPAATTNAKQLWTQQGTKLPQLFSCDVHTHTHSITMWQRRANQTANFCNRAHFGANKHSYLAIKYISVLHTHICIAIYIKAQLSAHMPAARWTHATSAQSVQVATNCKLLILRSYVCMYVCACLFVCCLQFVLLCARALLAAAYNIVLCRAAQQFLLTQDISSNKVLLLQESA